MNGLNETIDLMTSADYKDRFIAEYHQVKIRYDKLKDFCHKIEVSTMLATEEPKHDCPLLLLLEQLDVMRQYIDILEKRAIIEHVKL